MNSYKEKQYLVFELDDGKTVKYNLATGESIGKLGKPVKDIKTQLRGYELIDVIESFGDEKYRRFLTFVDGQVNKSTSHSAYSYRGRVDKIRNIGSFLQKIDDYKKYEQFFSSDIKRVEHPISCTFSEIPKGLVKLVRQYDLKLTDRLVSTYKDYGDMLNLLLSKEYMSISCNDIIRLLTYVDTREWIKGVGWEYRIGYVKDSYNDKFMRLINEYNYKPLSLLTHMDNLITYEALSNLETVIYEFYDYVLMMSTITNKYDKYPKNFLTSHRIASRNYNIMKVQFNEEIFNKRRDESLEFKYKNYEIVYPETTQDIKDEGCQLNHCVASYIGNVIDGRCHIVFLRHKDNLDKSLVTLEIRNDKVVQARGKFNRDVTSQEQEVINKYNKKLEKVGLKYVS
ncbi:MAG: PcfJ domain-containing protein [Sarcina sp.]